MSLILVFKINTWSYYDLNLVKFYIKQNINIILNIFSKTSKKGGKAAAVVLIGGAIDYMVLFL